MTARRHVAAVLMAGIAITCATIGARAQWATPDRLKEPGWWPTKGTVARGDFVGPGACRECHPSQSTTQPATQMARTAMKAEQSQLLATATPLSFATGSYSYRIARDENQLRYSVSSGDVSRSIVLTWAFGAGDIGQSFLAEHDGVFDEARVSYYRSLRGLAFTPGRALRSPQDAAQALARRVDSDEIQRCFGCHTTASTTEGRFDSARATPGITCEACHGPGRSHVAAMQRSGPARPPTAILNPVTLSPAASVDFCGACHATFWDIRLSGESGLAALRSQPYRLQLSRCWNGGDARATCVACHDPHKPLTTDLASYDARCLDCHVSRGQQPTAAQPGHACPAATSNCANCHMPRYEVPDMHQEFRDHFIRLPGRS